MTWEIIISVAGVISFAIPVGGLVWKLSSVISCLQTAVNNLNITLSKLTSQNETEHEDIYCTLEEHGTRIHDLEGKVK